MKGVLALDLGLITGWCFGFPGRKPVYGHVVLPGPGTGYGGRLCALTNAISDLIVEHQPGLVAKEAIMRLAGQNSAHVARLQFGYQACADEEAYRHDVPVVEEDADAIRGHMIGRRRPPKDVNVKDWIIAWVRHQGLPVVQPDQADAILIWHWACDVHADKLRPRKAA